VEFASGHHQSEPALSNLENCLKAVEDCDLFLGIIRTQCGTGYIDNNNHHQQNV
jgi:hypothetical protein